jgi:hypothetical protein
VSSFLEALDLASERALLQARKINVPRSGGKPNYFKEQAATYALVLLIQFGQKRPTLTAEGPFYRLAAVLHEIATGKTDVDLAGYCRKAPKEWSS